LVNGKGFFNFHLVRDWESDDEMNMVTVNETERITRSRESWWMARVWSTQQANKQILFWIL
jgi:hypothetical protein